MATDSDLRQLYGETLRRGGSLAAARRAREAVLMRLGAGEMLCDSVLWQVGERTPTGRERGIAQAFLEALWGIGIRARPSGA